jgi:hypothetical protein
MVLSTRLLIFSIGLLLIVSALSQVLSSFGGGVSKFIQITVMLIFVVAICHAWSKGEAGKDLILPAILIFFLVLNLANSLHSGDQSNLIVLTFLQLSFFYICLLFFESQSLFVLSKAVDLLEKIILVAISLSVIEFILPKVWMENILTFFLGGVPVSYISREFSGAGLRLGSIFLSPLTFSFSCVLLLVLSDVRSNKYSKFAYACLVLCKAKTGIVGGLLYLFRNVMFNWIKLTFIIFTVAVLLVPIFYDGLELLLIPSDSPYKSLSYHLVGLVSGIQGGYQNYFSGNGLGKSGYLLYLSVQNDLYASSPLHHLSPMLNGNESTFGVIAFQMGLVFLVLHVYLFFRYLSVFVAVGAKSSASFVLFVMVFQVFSESSLTIFVSLVIAMTLAWLRKLHVANTWSEEKYES